MSRAATFASASCAADGLVASGASPTCADPSTRNPNRGGPRPPASPSVRTRKSARRPEPTHPYNDDVVLHGIEANKLFVFATIKNVVQIGLDVGGGVGWMKGTATERLTQTQGGFSNPPPNATTNLPTTVTETEVPASTLVAVDPVPIGRVELAVGFILGPQLKVRASGGMNIPGTHIFSVSASVFF